MVQMILSSLSSPNAMTSLLFFANYCLDLAHVFFSSSGLVPVLCWILSGAGGLCEFCSHAQSGSHVLQEFHVIIAQSVLILFQYKLGTCKIMGGKIKNKKKRKKNKWSKKGAFAPSTIIFLTPLRLDTHSNAPTKCKALLLGIQLLPYRNQSILLIFR